MSAWLLLNQAVLREDLRWLRQRRIEAARLQRTMRTVSAGLVVLWATGLALWAFVSAQSPQPWDLSAKLCAKLVVVSLLTLNGWALHAWVFPTLHSHPPTDSLAGRLPAVLGAFSSASWLFASFIGVSRPLASVLSFANFMGLYAASLCLALLLALRVWRMRDPARSLPAETV